MNFKGDIIEESLQDTSILGALKTLEIRIEEVTEKHQTPYLKQWTHHFVEIPEEEAEVVAERVRQSLETVHGDWYADFKNDEYHYVIFPEKTFKVDLQDPKGYKQVSEYGVSLGIPAYQVNFYQDDQE